MKRIHLIVGALVGLVLIVALMVSTRGNAQSSNSDSRIQVGFDNSPVTLDLKGKNRALVGLGSYLVNVAYDCNICHNPGPGNNQFVAGGNPFLGEPKIINQATYLGGGRSFGPVVQGPSAIIIARNLTPDKTGLPLGGKTFEEFRLIMRTGVDLDHLHPTCVGVINSGCVPAPFNGDLLQVMPWYSLQNLTDHDLRATYEYLSAIPCVAGPPAPSPLHHDCQ